MEDSWDGLKNVAGMSNPERGDCCRPGDPDTIGRDPRAILRRSVRGDSLIIDVQVFQPIAFSSPQLIPPVPTTTPTPGVPPVNITSWTAYFTAKYNFPDVDNQAIAQISLTTSVPAGGSIVFVSPLVGQMQIVVPGFATQGFPDSPTDVLYDIQMTNLSNQVFTVERGIWRVLPNVTRA